MRLTARRLAGLLLGAALTTVPAAAHAAVVCPGTTYYGLLAPAGGTLVSNAFVALYTSPTAATVSYVAFSGTSGTGAFSFYSCTNASLVTGYAFYGTYNNGAGAVLSNNNPTSDIGQPFPGGSTAEATFISNLQNGNASAIATFAQQTSGRAIALSPAGLGTGVYDGFSNGQPLGAIGLSDTGPVQLSSVVPEPASLALTGVGLVLIGVVRRRRAR